MNGIDLDHEVKLGWAVYQAKLWLEVASRRFDEAGYKREAARCHRAQESLALSLRHIGPFHQSA